MHGGLVRHHLPKGGVTERGNAANGVTVINHSLDQGQSFDLSAAVDPLCTLTNRAACDLVSPLPDPEGLNGNPRKPGRNPGLDNPVGLRSIR